MTGATTPARRRQGFASAGTSSKPQTPFARGFATLSLCLLLLMLLTLTAVWIGQHLGTAQRVVTADRHAAVASEAAEAGLAWAVAMLNSGRVDDDCRASLNTGAGLRARVLTEGADHQLRASPARVAARCVLRTAGAWQCRCDGGLPASDNDEQPSFEVRLTDGSMPGRLELVARGCSRAGYPCDPQDGRPAAEAAHQQTVALLSALRRPPTRAVSEGPGAWLEVFELPAARYRQQPALTRLDCMQGPCEAALAQAIAHGRRLLWVDGDLSLSQPLPSPPPEPSASGPASPSPLLIAVNGHLDISASMTFTGALYARDGIRWFPQGPGTSELRGALVTEGRWQGAPGLRLHHDPDVLLRISRQLGTLLPVPGSWSPAP